MKALKKLTAIVLAVCMLIGMPLSIDVAATGDPSSEKFKLVSGMIIPDSWGTTLDGDTQMSLYFTGGPITIDTSKVKVIVGIGTMASGGWWDGQQLNRVEGVWLTGTLSQSNELLGGTTKTGSKNPNNWVFTVDNTKTWPKADFKAEYQWAIEGDTVDTLTELKALSKLTKSDLIVKIIETVGTAGDNVIDGVTEGTTKLVANAATANVNHGNMSGGNDVAYAKVYDKDDAPQMTGVYLDNSTKKLNVRFNEGLAYAYRGNAYIYTSIRVINNRGMIYSYNANDGFYTYKSNQDGLLNMELKMEATTGGIITYGATDHTYQLSDDQYNTLTSWQALVDAHNATAAAEDQLKVALIFEEKNVDLDTSAAVKPSLVEGRGDGMQNHYIDSIWTSSEAPFMPNYTDIDGWVADCMALEILTIDALKEQSVTIEKVTPVSRIGATDRLIVEFSEAVNISAIDSYVRVFDSTGKLMTHDSTTGTLTENGTSGYLQWAAAGWTKADVDGKVWQADLYAGMGCDSYADIVNYVASLKNSDGTPVSGLSIELSLVDKGGFKTYNNYRVDSVTAVADSSKKLFANNTQDSGEDRATSAITPALTVADVEIYADEYVIVTFSEDIDVDAAIASMSTNNFWLGAHKNPSTGGDTPVTATAGGSDHIHAKLTDARKFGNATNKLLFTLDKGWADLKAKIDAYEAANGAVEVCVRVEGGGAANSVIVPGITSADGTLKLYRSNPAPSWGGRLMIATELIPAVTVSNVKADTDKNMLIVTFSEPVKYTAQTVTLNDGKGGTYQAKRSQVALQRFKTADMTLDMDNLYQVNATAYTASDANGNAVTDEYSTCWAFTFPEGVVETAVNYYADGNSAYTDEIGYGFGVFEASAAGTWSGGLADESMVLPLRTYCDDFATAPDADGNVKYLKASSTSSGVRFFKEVYIAPGQAASLITAEAKLTAADTVQVTFSEPVKISADGYNSIRVTEKSNLVGPDNANYQMGGTMTAVSPDGEGYASVWTFKVNNKTIKENNKDVTYKTITQWAQKYFFANAYSVTDGITLCLSMQSNKGMAGDGMTDYITGKNGGVLAASPYDHGAEGTYVNIGSDPMFFTDSVMQDVELIGQTDAIISMTALQGYPGTRTWRILDGATGVTKVIDGVEAVWTVSAWINYLNGNTKIVASDIVANLGVKTIDGIRALMDADDKLVFALSDGRVNGVVEDLYLTAANGFKMQKAHFSTATEDVAYIEVDVTNTAEALTVTDISTYTRLLQTYANKDEYLVVTFSHDITDETVAKIKDGTVKFWMTVKDTASNNWWYDFGDGRGYVLNGSTPYHSQVAAGNFQRYGNAGNKLVAAVSGSEYKKLVDRVADINAKLGYEAAELVIRVECSSLSGLAGVNSYMKATDSTVYPMILDQGWNGGGRTYTPAFNDGKEVHVGAIELIDGNTAEIKFVDNAGNPVIVTNQLYRPNSGIYVAIRLTKDGKLAWSENGQLAAEGTGSPMQFDASLNTKNGTTADSTWVLSCSRVNMAELMQALNDEDGYLRKNGVDMAFALEGGETAGQMSDYVDVFSTLDGKGVLKFTTDTNMSATHRYFFSYLNNKTKWITGDLVKETVKITESKLVNNATVQLTFDKAVNITGTNNWFRIVDGVNNVIRFDKSTGEPLGNIMNVGENGGVGIAQVSAKMTKVDTEGKVWNFAINGGLQGNYGFADIVEFVEGLPATGNWNGNLKFALILEENGSSAVKYNGLTDHVVTADGSKLVNDQMGRRIGDGTCIDITSDMTAEFDEGVTITSAKQINKNQILVKFSEAVTVADPFIGLRLVDANGELIWSARDAQGNTIRGNYHQGSAVQWGSTKKELSEDGTELLVTFKQDVSVILDASNLPACLSPTSNPDYEIKLVIEETKPEASGEAGKSGYVCDVVAKADAKKMLESNTKHTNSTSWDGNAVSVEAITADTLITVSDAKITGENQVTFEWSHSVDLTNSGTYYAAFRYINADTHVLYGNDKDGWMQFGAYLNYVGEGMTKMTAHVMPNTKWGVYDLDDLLNPTGALKEYMDANPGKWIVRIEEKGGTNGNGTIDTYAGKDGTTIQADPLIGSWADGVDMDIVGTPITGSLSVTAVELISDTQVKVTFSDPVQYAKVNDKESKPFVSMRLYNANNQLLFWNPITEEYTTTETMKDKDGNQIYKNQNGYTTEKEGYNAEGVWVPYASQRNQAMQWPASNVAYGDKNQTTVIYTLGGGEQLPIQNMTDLLNYDFSAFGEGCYVGFDIEENTPAGIWSDGHVNNIVRKDNSKIALDANFFPHNRDSVMVTLDNIKISYKPYKINSKTEIISDTQIRISFTEPVKIDYNPFMAIRMIDKEGNLMWSGEENLSTPFQWTGSWKWEDDSHTAIIWSMNPGMLGGKSIYELANWVGPLAKFKDEATWMFVIEELDNTKNNFIVGRFNNLVDNVTSLDGTVHLTSTYSKGYDGILTKLNTEDLIGPEIELLSAKALDDQTIELTFTEAVNMDEDVSLGVRYLSPSGDSEVLTDGKVAYFKGDWEYKDDTKKVIIWTLNTKNADNLTDIINYNGKFEWNQGARVAFVIMDAEDNRANPQSLKINGVYDLQNGFRRLKANYATEDYPMAQLDIEVLYDIPAPESQAGSEQQAEVVYVTNYIPFIIASAVIAVAGLVIAIILFKKRKNAQ